MWLRQASCRGYQLDTITLSEPLPSFWVGLLLSKAPRGWARVMEGFHRLVSSLRIVTMSAGDIGETVGRILLAMSLDHSRFGTLGRSPTLEEAKARSVVRKLDFLKQLVRPEKHEQLEQYLEAVGLISAVRFRTVRHRIEKVSQAELAHLWYSGEAIVGAPSQPDWDLLVPYQNDDIYSVVVFQVKNHVDGPPQPLHRSWGPRTWIGHSPWKRTQFWRAPCRQDSSRLAGLEGIDVAVG